MPNYLPEPEISNDFHERTSIRRDKSGGYDGNGAADRIRDAAGQIIKGGAQTAIGLGTNVLGGPASGALAATGIANIGTGISRVGLEGISFLGNVDISEGTDAMGNIDNMIMEKLLGDSVEKMEQEAEKFYFEMERWIMDQMKNNKGNTPPPSSDPKESSGHHHREARTMARADPDMINRQIDRDPPGTGAGKTQYA